MHKHTQKELLDEGFWDPFKKVGKQALQGAIELSKVALPQTYQNVSNIRKNIKLASGAIKQAGKTTEEIILDWIDEMGFIPTENSKPKKIRNFGGGKTHWALDVGVKGVTDDGEPIIIRRFDEPRAIVQYDDVEQQIKFVLRPDRRRMYDVDDGIYLPPTATPTATPTARKTARKIATPIPIARKAAKKAAKKAARKTATPTPTPTPTARKAAKKAARRTP